MMRRLEWLVVAFVVGCAAGGGNDAGVECERDEDCADDGRGGALAAGIAGGLIALVMAGGLQFAGLLPAPGNRGEQPADPTPAIDALEQEIATLRSEIGAAGTPDPELGGRVSQAEERVTALASQIGSGAVTTYTPDIEAIMSSRKGICFDYAAVMASMLRSQGIPTKLVMGYVPQGYHAWNEVYFEGVGWVIVASFRVAEINGSGYVMFDSTFGAAGMTIDSINAVSRQIQKVY